MQPIIRSSFILLMVAIVPASTALSLAEDTGRATETPVVGPSLPKAMDRLKDFTFEQRDEFAARVKNLGAQSDAAIAELSTGYVEMQAAPARRAAMDALKAADVSFKEKSAAIDNASVDTWETVKSNLITSWGNLETALQKARAAKA